MSGSSGWQISAEVAQNYRRFTLPNMIPWIDDLIASARCGDGERVLDVACGTGLIANRVAELYPKSKITGIDLNEGMLTLAKENTAIEWHQGNATALPFKDKSFDVVLCQQGLQYFPDRGKAVQEMARVLVPGGRLALNVWGPLQRAVFLVSLVDKVGQVLGADATQPFNQGYSLNTCEELRKLARAAGFSRIHVRIEHRTARYPDVREYALGFLSMTPIAARVQALPESEKSRLADQVHADMETWIDDDGLAAVHENHFLTATR